MIKPLIPIKQEDLDEIAKSLLETGVPVITPAQVEKPQNYLLLPQTREHPEIPISLTRLVYTPTMQPIAQKLSLTLANNSNTNVLYSNGYIGNINHTQSLQINKALDGINPPINLFVEFLNELRSGSAFYANGNRIPKSFSDSFLDDILTVRSPYRAEWFDNVFHKQGRTDKTKYHKFDTSGQLVEVTEQLDPATLMEDKQVSLDDWLSNPTSQGLPRVDVATGNLYYWLPREGKVALFDAGSDGAILICDGDATFSGPGLGVRSAKIKT